MKKGKVISLVTAMAVLMSTNVMAATVYTGNTDVDLWSKAIYTDQSRIYGTGSYRQNYEWPGTTTLRNASYPQCLLEGGSMSIDEVFGENCQDLLFTDIDKTKDPIAYMEDGDRVLRIYQMAEHNGFLYVLTGGYKSALTAKDGTDVYGTTKSYNVAARTDASGFDSYLYVFDISRGENYGKSRYVRWSAADLGLQSGNALQYMEGIAVDDNNIYILVNNGSANSYSRGVAVFKNTVKRGTAAVAPSRVDNIESDYVYGAKTVVPLGTSSSATYNSYIVNGNLISFSANATFSLADTKAMVYVTPVGKNLGETTIYTADSIATLLKSEVATSWSNATSPVIRDINVDGNDITFLVTYTYGGKIYKEVFVTDWSDVTAPILLDSIAYETTDTDLSSYCYTYDGYIYVSSLSGIEIIKKYDYNNVKLVYNSKLDLTEINTLGKALGIAVSGDYILAWANQDQNSGYELKIRLNADKTEIVESVSKKGPLRTGDALVYGGRIYTKWGGIAGVNDAVRQSCIFVADTNSLMPISLTVDKVESEGFVPYTITGSGLNIDAVKVLVNGNDQGYVKTTADSGESKWEYTVKEAGDYTIEFIGASMEGYDCDGTSETVKFKAYAKNNISMTASYVVANNIATVTINITNPYTIDAKMMPIAGIYSDNAMVAVAFGEEIEVGAGKSETVTLKLNIPASAIDYKVKTFLIGGTNKITPMAEAVEN